MKISKQNLAIGAIITGVIIAFMDLFNLIEGVKSPDNLYWPIIIIFLIILSSNIDTYNYDFVRKNFPFIRRYAYATMLSLVVIVVGTSLAYPQVITRTLREIMPYMMFLMAVPMLMYIIRNNGITGLLSIINGISLVWFVLIILQKIIYQRNGVIFFASTFEYQIRNGIRISLSCLGNLSLIFNLYQLWYVKRSKRSRFCGITAVLGFYSLFAIQQTRSLILAVCVSCLIMILSDSRRDVYKVLKKCLVFVLLIFIIYSTGLLNSFLGSFFDESSIYGDTTTVRLSGIKYYFDIFKNNPLFGFGFASVADYNSLINGPYGSYFLNDVGIVGQMARLGVFIIPIYIWPVLRFVRITIETYKVGNLLNFSLLLAMVMYLIITSVSVIMIDSARSIGMPLYFAVFEYQHFKNTVLRDDEMLPSNEEELS